MKDLASARFEEKLAAELRRLYGDTPIIAQNGIKVAQEMQKDPEFATTYIANRKTFSTTWFNRFCKDFDLQKFGRGSYGTAKELQKGSENNFRFGKIIC